MCIRDRGNINDEPWFVRDLAACAQPGDLAVLDCQLVRAPADQPDKIREIDPPIRAKRPVASYNDFLAGPLRRHCRGLQGIRLRTELSTHCPVPGSYALENWAAVEKEDEPLRQFLVFRIKRYDVQKLSEFLLSLGSVSYTHLTLRKITLRKSQLMHRKELPHGPL